MSQLVLFKDPTNVYKSLVIITDTKIFLKYKNFHFARKQNRGFFQII